jgi:hypothetical protein
MQNAFIKRSGCDALRQEGCVKQHSIGDYQNKI